MSQWHSFQTLSNRIARGGLSPAVFSLLLASTTLNVVQASKLGLFTQPAVVQPEPGTRAATVVGETIDGRPVEIAFGEEPTILYYFSPACGWCERNWLNIKALQASTEGRYRFIGLSTTPDVKKFMQDHGLLFDVYSNLSADTVRAFHFGGTPQTVVVGSDGRVQYTWMGAYGKGQQRAVERALDIILPGLSSPETTTR
jgi:peroxiredoxin